MSNEKQDIRELNKLRGGYYTPQQITDFICKWAITEPNQLILEPSCGDGNFIESAIKRFLSLGVSPKNLFGLIKGIELDKEEAEKAKFRAASYGLNSTTIINSDFFRYIADKIDTSSYDVVVGNPPFIRYQDFPEDHRKTAFQMMKNIGLNPNRLTNIWTPFLVISSIVLSNKGKLGMVIPAELFQVKYAAETRVFLSKFFSRITIITFKKLVFKEIQQEIVILLCEKTALKNKGIRVLEINDVEELNKINVSKTQDVQVKSLDHSTEKWTKYYLNEDEIYLLRKIRLDSRIKTCGNYLSVDVGAVTGRNDFFILDFDSVKKWELTPYVRRIVSKSKYLKGVVFGNKDYHQIASGENKSYLFLPPNERFGDLPNNCQRYIDYGQRQKYHLGFKCRNRGYWYITPSLWIPDLFILRQVSGYPKIIINNAAALSTDTIHRAKMISKITPKIVAVSFINSLTFAFSEVSGRSYGGGVLTFEPTEIEEMPLPILNKTNCIDMITIDKLVREGKIEEALNIIDKALLINQLGYTIKEVKMLRGIWKKMSDRRKNRSH